MQTETHNTFTQAIVAAKRMEEQKGADDFAAFLPVPEIYRTDDAYIVVLPSSLLEERSGFGQKLGYYDGEFRPVEEVRAEVERDRTYE